MTRFVSRDAPQREPPGSYDSVRSGGRVIRAVALASTTRVIPAAGMTGVVDWPVLIQHAGSRRRSHRWRPRSRSRTVGHARAVGCIAPRCTGCDNEPPSQQRSTEECRSQRPPGWRAARGLNGPSNIRLHQTAPRERCSYAGRGQRGADASISAVEWLSPSVTLRASRWLDRFRRWSLTAA